ncbi:MAG: thiol reductant ABC exporter subunit CydC [Hyphomicrobiales bacterium]|uniref:thiol reductant ABC exporter subunit CydC n=1 Tax=Rhabdaerophilum calidifontis TaxID=2604328 RepID=UPI0012391697|nr:thiol reductant ABC exporter subunit CydC [Rhabdaerophilum calidifontis]MCA1999499.1 thiol reductant ABC exporter subunit CydC [Hyphomicrobiales bacterium]
MTDLARLFRLMRPQAGWMALAILLSAVATGAHVALMATSGWFITSMALAGLAGITMNYFTPAALIRGFAIIRTAGRYGERLIGHEATLRFVARLRPWLFSRIERAAPANLGDLRSADLLTRLRSDIDRMELGFLRVLSPVLAGLIVLVPVLIWLALKRPDFALVLTILLVVSGVLLPAALLAASRRAERSLVAQTPRLNAALVETVDGQAELAVYDPDGHHRAATLALANGLLADEDRIARTQALGNTAVPLAAHLGLPLLLCMGIPAVREGSLAPADLPMLALLGLALFDTVAGWPLAIQSIPILMHSARRVFELADRPSDVPDPVAPEPIPLPLSIQFSGVSFRYPDARTGGLRNIDLTLSPGRRIAILGPSGAGKSTLGALAMRFYQPSKGVISAGNTDYRAISGEKLRRHVAMLGQHDHLFSGSIRDNLLMADPGASPGALEQACRTARILPFIEGLPEGFETWVGAHGKALSGGEGRRLLLARTLLRRPELLILDEPTEGLDPATEQAVIEAIIADHPEAGILLLTHRLVGLDKMHACFSLESGQLVAQRPQRLASGPIPRTIEMDGGVQGETRRST